MPKIPKPARKAADRQVRNKSVRTFTKTSVAKAEDLISKKDLAPAREATVRAVSALDKAAKKGVLHPNNVARRKSRLMKKLNQADKN